MKIIIDDEWSIEDDALCYILKKNTKHEVTKNGETRIVSSDKSTYHYSVESALQSMCDKVRLEKTRDFVGSIENYIERIFDINSELNEKIKHCQIVRNEDDGK